MNICLHNGALAAFKGDERLPQDSTGYEEAGVTVKQCTSCQTLLSRDVSAACVILGIFEFQRQEKNTFLTFYVRNNNTEWSPLLWGMREP